MLAQSIAARHHNSPNYHWMILSSSDRCNHRRQPSRTVSKRFFFEKKNQKTFAPAGVGTGRATAPSKRKFFASFFKKEALA
jgi:hypothetical protein